MKKVKTYENFLHDYTSFNAELDKAKVNFENSVLKIYTKEEEILKETFERLSHYTNNFFDGGSDSQYFSRKGFYGSSFLAYFKYLITGHRLTKEFVNEELEKNTFRFGANTDIRVFVLDILATLSELNLNESIGTYLCFYANDFYPESSRQSVRFSNLNVPEISTDGASDHIENFSTIPTPLSKLRSEEEFVDDIVRKLTPGQFWKDQKFLIAEFRLFFK